MKKSGYCILLLCLLIPGFLYPQKGWDLKTCLSYGLKNHRSTKIYQNKITAAAEKSREARSAYLPSIDATGGIADNIKPQVSVIPAGAFSPTDIKVAFTKQYSATGQIELNQPIFDKSALIGLKAGRYNKEVASLNLHNNEETLIYNISTAYYQLNVYLLQLQLLQANEQSYREQLRIAQLGVDKGVTAEVDLNKIKVNYNNILSDINVAEGNIETMKMQLKNEMGYPLEDSLQVDSLLPSVEGQGGAGIVPLLREEMPDTFRVTNRADYLVSKAQLSLLDIDARKIRAGKLPTLSFYARYGTNGFGNTLGESVNYQNSWSVIGLTLKAPLFSGFKRNAQYNQARLDIDNARETLSLDAAKYKVEYEQAKTRLSKAKEKIVNDQRNIQLAKDVFKSTDLQYRKGVTDLTDWLNAQYSLKEAQNNYLNSLYSFYSAKIELEKANGTLANYYKSL